MEFSLRERVFSDCQYCGYGVCAVSRTCRKRIYALLGSLSILWSAGVAARHVWLQNLPPDQVPSCGPGLNYLIDALPLKSVLAQVLTGSGECAVIDWTFLGQSLPVWSLLFFVVLTVVSLWQLVRRYPTAAKAKK